MAKDIFHDIVKDALVKDGWTITHDPYQIKTKGITYNIDLGGEKILAAERGLEKIAVEVKSFIGPSNTYAFHEALGQFLVYEVNMKVQDPERVLFLAVPVDIYDSLFHLEAIELAASTFHLRILVFDPTKNEIESWTKK